MKLCARGGMALSMVAYVVTTGCGPSDEDLLVEMGGSAHLSQEQLIELHEDVRIWAPDLDDSMIHDRANVAAYNAAVEALIPSGESEVGVRGEETIGLPIPAKSYLEQVHEPIAAEIRERMQAVQAEVQRQLAIQRRIDEVLRARGEAVEAWVKARDEIWDATATEAEKEAYRETLREHFRLELLGEN